MCTYICTHTAPLCTYMCTLLTFTLLHRLKMASTGEVRSVKFSTYIRMYIHGQSVPWTVIISCTHTHTHAHAHAHTHTHTHRDYTDSMELQDTYYKFPVHLVHTVNSIQCSKSENTTDCMFKKIRSYSLWYSFWEQLKSGRHSWQWQFQESPASLCAYPAVLPASPWIEGDEGRTQTWVYHTVQYISFISNGDIQL